MVISNHVSRSIVAMFSLVGSELRDCNKGAHTRAKRDFSSQTFDVCCKLGYSHAISLGEAHMA